MIAMAGVLQKTANDLNKRRAKPLTSTSTGSNAEAEQVFAHRRKRQYYQIFALFPPHPTGREIALMTCHQPVLWRMMVPVRNF
ncbi:MAG: hypothetical protein OSB82_18835 [Alphaproteobacteria bacterium]|nr:hypothetical protein [Alphaproteobacteria bacterium]